MPARIPLRPCYRAHTRGHGSLSGRRNQINPRDPTRDVDVVQVPLDFQLVKLRAFDVRRRKHAVMESILNGEQVMPVRCVRRNHRTVGS